MIRSIVTIAAVSLCVLACGTKNEPAPASQDEAKETAPQADETAPQAAEPASQEASNSEEAAPAETADDNAEAEAAPAAPPSGSLDAYVAPPPPSKTFNAVTEKLGVIKRCYFDELAKKPGLQGQITIRFTVNKKGKVTKAKATVNELNDNVEKCVVKVLKEIDLPAPEGGETTLEYPFSFMLSE